MEGQVKQLSVCRQEAKINTDHKTAVELYPSPKRVYSNSIGKRQDEILMLLNTNPERGLVLLIEKYSGYVYTIIKNKLIHRTRQDIEECASDVFYSIYQSRDRINEAKGNLAAFVCTVAKRKAIDYMRKRSQGDAAVLEDVAADIQSPDNVTETVFAKEQKEALIRAVQKLDDVDTKIVIRRYYFGQSNKEIAYALHMNENAVSKRGVRAMRKLEKILESEGFGNE